MADNLAQDGIDAWADSRADIRWLSYDDLVELTGIKRASVTRMVRRKKWAKRHGNERGSIRIAVPADAIEEMDARRHAKPPAPEAPPEEYSPEVLRLARVILKLEATLADVRAERDLLQSELEQERETANEARLVGEQNWAEVVEERMKTADHRGRLSAQISALAAELARLHATTRAPTAERLAIPAPRLGRVAAIARWLRPGG